MRKRKNMLGIALLLVLLIIGITACAGGKKEESVDRGQASKEQAADTTKTRQLRYGYTATNSDAIPGLAGIAQKQGYFKEELGKVNAEFVPVPFVKAGPAINQALASKELDVANLGDVPSAVSKASGAETELIDVQPSDYSTHLIIRNGLDISSVKELKGKKVAVSTGSYLQRILYQILEKNGLSPEDVKLVNMTEVDAANAITGGSIDATVVSAMKGVTLEKSNSAKLLLDTKGNSEFSRLTTYVARTEYAEKNSDILEAYFKALLRARDYVKEHPEDFRQIYIDSGIAEDVVDKVYPKPSDYGSEVGATKESLENYQNVADFLLKNSLIKSELKISDWYNGEYFEKSK